MAVKGKLYTVDEFLFGRDVKHDFMVKKCKEAQDRGWKLNFMIIYLAPGDYHWYHSATNFVTNYWRHIVGYLAPVKPSYVEKHKNVFKDNERVTLFGDWA